MVLLVFEIINLLLFAQICTNISSFFLLQMTICSNTVIDYHPCLLSAFFLSKSYVLYTHLKQEYAHLLKSDSSSMHILSWWRNLSWTIWNPYVCIKQSIWPFIAHFIYKIVSPDFRHTMFRPILSISLNGVLLEAWTRVSNHTHKTFVSHRWIKVI